MRNQGTGSWPARRARMTPDKTALISGGADSTYRQVHERATRLAGALAADGIGAGDRVAFLGQNSTAFADVLFAAGMLGAIFVPLNYRLTQAETDVIIRDCGAAVLLTPDSAAGLLASGPAGPEPADIPVSLGDVCMIQYTSGTSGKPKGVALSHANIAWNCYNLLIDVDVAADEVSLVSAPMFHTAALNQLFLPTFLKGGTSVLMPAWDPDQAYELIERYRVTWMFGVPAMFAAMAGLPRWATADLSSVRILMCGGAPVPAPLIATYQQRGLTFVQGYGMTETAPGALFLRAPDSVRKAGSAGTPCFFTDVRIVRPDFTDVAAGEPGEVVIQGPNVSPGYWGDAAATADAFQDGWLRSGDTATIDEDGYVRISGRVKDMYISGGENVYPAEVESAISAHPAVAECAVLGVPDERWGETGRAVVVLRAEAAASAEEIIASLDGVLARYKIPRTVVFAAALPRNTAGKVVKARLREQYGT